MDRMFVAVRCECYEDGTVLPIGITWPDGRFWEITRTLHVSEAVDGEYEGIRYTVLIGSAENTYTGQAHHGTSSRLKWRWTHLEKMYSEQGA